MDIYIIICPAFCWKDMNICITQPSSRFLSLTTLSLRSSRGTRTPNCVPYNVNRVFRSGVQSIASGLSQVAAICDRLRGNRYKPHRLYKNTDPHIFFFCVYRVYRFYNFKFEHQFLFCSRNIRYVPLETYTAWSVKRNITIGLHSTMYLFAILGAFRKKNKITCKFCHFRRYGTISTKTMDWLRRNSAW